MATLLGRTLLGKGGIREAPTIPAVRASVAADPQVEVVVVREVENVHPGGAKEDAAEAAAAGDHEAFGMYWHGGLDLDSVELPE